MTSPMTHSKAPRIAIIGSGSGTTAQHVMESAGEIMQAEVGLVLSNKSDAGILDRARAHGVPALHLSSVTHPDPMELDSAVADALEQANADLLILAGYLKKLGPLVLNQWNGNIVNTHPALLPAYGGKGMYGDYVHEAVLADGPTRTGASIHAVTPEYDEGPVLAQTVVPVGPDDNVASLRSRVQAAEKDLLINWLVTRCGAVDATGNYQAAVTPRRD